jgi:sulfite reductase (NADPH) flavoprotein alpha-component
MKLPPEHKTPVVMAGKEKVSDCFPFILFLQGLGTGMAPFRAFIEERAYLKQHGVEVGPMVLYFGSRSRYQEYLYGEELESYKYSILKRTNAIMIT